MPFSDNNSLRPLYIYTTASLIVVAVLSSILSYLVLASGRRSAATEWLKATGTNSAAMFEWQLEADYRQGQALLLMLGESGLQPDTPALRKQLTTQIESIRDYRGLWLLSLPQPAPTGEDSQANANTTNSIRDKNTGPFTYAFRDTANSIVVQTALTNYFQLVHAQKAARETRPFLTPLYINPHTQEKIYSLIIPQRAANKATLVLGIDFSPNRLTAMLRSIRPNWLISSILSDDLRFVAHSHKSDFVDTSVQKNDPIVRSMQSLALSLQHTETEKNLLTGEESVKVRTRITLPGDGGFWVMNLIAPVNELTMSAGGIRNGIAPLLGLLLAACFLNVVLLRMATRRVLMAVSFFRQILESSPAPVSVCQLDNTIAYMNRSALNIANSGLGVTIAEAINKPCHAIWKSSRCLTAECPSNLLLRENINTTHTNINGVEYEIFTSLLRDVAGNPTATCKYFRDINDLRNIEAVIDASPSGIMVIDQQSGEIIILNRAAAEMYGCSDKKFLTGKKCPAMAATNADRRDTETYASGPLEPVDGVTPPDNAPRHLLRSQQLRYIGNRKCIVISYIDVSRQKETQLQLYQRNYELERANNALREQQRQLVHQEKMASIGQLAAGVAHEINNPVGYVNSNLHTLKEYLGVFQALFDICEEMFKARNEPERIQELINEIASVAVEEDIPFVIEDTKKIAEESIEGMNRVRDIVKNLKSFARPDPETSSVCDINEQIRLTLKMVHNELKYKCTVNEEYGALPNVRCSGGEINQVIMNLIINAANAIERTGVISIRTQCREDDGAIVISIADNGCGIPPENIKRIFDPFFTTKEVGKGTGLGLYISHGIVTKYNGDIAVESTPEQGTIFTVTLPPEIRVNE